MSEKKKPLRKVSVQSLLHKNQEPFSLVEKVTFLYCVGNLPTVHHVSYTGKLS